MEKFFVYGNRDEGKSYFSQVPCPNCDFIGNDVIQLGEHFDKEHGFIWLFSALPFENYFKNLICPKCKKPISQCNHKTMFLEKPQRNTNVGKK